MNLTGPSKLIRNQDIIFSEIEGEAILIDGELERYFGMEPIATEIWRLLENEVTFDDLLDKLLNNYEVSKDQCAADVTEFLKKLSDQKMITITN